MFKAVLQEPRSHTSTRGFTIVELLIVVVVIAILASITIVSYNGITKSANNSNLQSMLSQALRKIEIFKINSDDSSLPATLSEAGLGSLSGSDTTYAYTRSGDGKQYCLAASKAGRTYFITETSSRPQPGICDAAIGVAGTGDVATDTVVAPTTYSIFSNQAPSPSPVLYGDGSALIAGNRFYTTETNGIKVVGMRVYSPSNSDSGDLALNLTAYAYMNDWKGVVIPGTGTFSLSPVATKIYTGTRTKSTWTDILFDTPITLPSITPTANGNDLITLAVRYADNRSYAYSLQPSSTFTESTMRPNNYLAEDAQVGKGINNNAPATTFKVSYGIDMLFQPIP